MIRHKLDYGAILLCDQRFASPDLIRQLSSWVRSRVVTFPKIGPLLRDLGMFFRNADIMFPGSAKAVRAPVVIDSSREEMKKSHSTVDSFHHALSSDSSRVVPQHAKANNKIRESEQIDLSGYSTTMKPSTSQERSIFDGSEPATKFIDFNETESPASSSKTEFKPSVCQPAVKKRKITIVSDAEKAKYDRKKMKAATNDCPQPTSSQESSSSLSLFSEPNVPKKKENAAEYLKTVRSLLDSVTYTTFTNMIRTYRSEKNYDSLVTALKKIFLQDVKLRHMFKGLTNY